MTKYSKFIIVCAFICTIDGADETQSLQKKHCHEQETSKKNDAYHAISISKLASRSFYNDCMETLTATDDVSGAKLGNILLRVFAHDNGRTVEVEHLVVFPEYKRHKIGTRLMAAVPHFFSATQAIFLVST